jgi:dodecin
VKIDHVVGVQVRDDDGIDTVAGHGPEMVEQAGQRAVTEVDHHPEAVVLEDESTARSSGLWPGAAAAQHHHAAVGHGSPMSVHATPTSTAALWCEGFRDTMKVTELEESAVSVYRVTELIGTSTESWEDAATSALTTAQGTVRGLRVAEVVEQDINIDEGGGYTFRTKLRVSFKYESE